MISPTAISGESIIAIELILVINSGNEVIEAIRKRPTQAFPTPVRSAIISPYFDKREPAKTMRLEQAKKPKIDSTMEGIYYILGL